MRVWINNLTHLYEGEKMLALVKLPIPDVGDHKTMEKLQERLVHKALEDKRGVSQPIRHSLIFIVACRR